MLTAPIAVAAQSGNFGLNPAMSQPNVYKNSLFKLILNQYMPDSVSHKS